MTAMTSGPRHHWRTGTFVIRAWAEPNPSATSWRFRWPYRPNDSGTEPVSVVVAEAAEVLDVVSGGRTGCPEWATAYRGDCLRPGRAASGGAGQKDSMPL